jgi:hypothetical protein
MKKDSSKTLKDIQKEKKKRFNGFIHELVNTWYMRGVVKFDAIPRNMK